MRRYRFAVLIPLLLVPRGASPQGEPLGPEFRVNTPAPFNKQGSSSVASAGGDFVVVWDGSHADGYGAGAIGVRGLRYDSAGNPLGTEFRVNTYTPDTQQFPAVAADASGGFVVVWDNWHPLTPLPPPLFSWSIFGQRYAASGAPAGPEFIVSGAVSQEQGGTAIAVAPSGAFLVVWSRALSQAPPGPFDLFARRFDSFGVPQGPEFRVNTFTTGSQGQGAVAADPAGNFMVVWADFQYVSVDVVGRRFAASGAPLGPEFRVNAYAGGSGGPAVAADPYGNFVVAWGDTFSGDPPVPGISGRRFGPDGTPLGPEFRVNTSIGGNLPAIAVDGGGNFVIAWAQVPSGTGDVFGQRYSSLGVPSGPEFRVNTTTTDWQRNASVASTPGGTFLVTWDSGPAGFVSDDVFGQRFGGVFPVELQDFRLE